MLKTHEIAGSSVFPIHVKLSLKIGVPHHLRVSLTLVCITVKVLKFSSAFRILLSFSNE